MNRLYSRQFLQLALIPSVLMLLAGPALAQTGKPTKAQIAAELQATTYQGEQLATITPKRTGRLDAAQVMRAWRPGDAIRYIPKRIYPARPLGAPVNPTTSIVDPLLHLQRKYNPYGTDKTLSRGVGFGSPDVNFPGQLFSGALPPDTVGDVGPTAYVQMINASGGSGVAAWDKSGTPLFGPVTLSSTLGSGVCATGAGDPIVVYDNLADRWLLSEFSDLANALCVYISQTADPGGTYHSYIFTTPNFPDYPKYGLHPEAYTVTSNEPGPSPIYILPRADMLAGLAASATRLTVPDLPGFGFQGLTPAVIDGPAPGAGQPTYFARHRDDEVHNPGSNNPTQDFIELYTLDVSGATLSGPQNIPIAEIDSDLCGLTSFNCFEQPNGQRLDPLREVLMWRLQYRNFGAYETLVGNLTTDVSGADRGGIRWFELRDEGSGWSLFQEGTHAPDTDNRWMGSVAMDGSGNIAVGYSVVSPTQFTDIRYAGRQAGDPAGTLPDSEFVIGAGSASQNAERWGDYSSMNVDPADDCSFWYTTEYVTSANNWDTRIASFKYPDCGTPAVCGNGIIEAPEQCDDGNQANGDGCSSSCVIEPDFTCTGQPSVCVPVQPPCLVEDFEGSMPGWTKFNVGPLPLDWGRTDDGQCFSNNLPPVANVTGGSGEAACIDSDAAGNGVVESYLCSPELAIGTGTTEFSFLVNYQTFGLPDPDDFFEILVGTEEPNSLTIADYSTEFITSMNTGGFATLPGVSQTLDLSAYAGQSVHFCLGYKANFDWYAQVDDIVVTSSGGCPAGADVDSDGVLDALDNCITQSNPAQIDTNGDGFGNACDQDLAGPAGIGADDCFVNFNDLNAMKAPFFSSQGSPNYNPDADFTGINGGDPDGFINFADLDRMKTAFFNAPGPSANGPCVPITPGFTNGSFETGDFSGWIATDVPGPIFPLIVGGFGESTAFFTSAPTDGVFAALHGFDGAGPGVIRVGQDIQITAEQPIVVFDYRGAWDMTGCFGCSDRVFEFHLEPPGGGFPVGTGTVLTAMAETTNPDTGNVTFGFDLTAFAGQTVHAVFAWTIPDNFTGPGFFQLDNVRLAAPAALRDGSASVEIRQLRQVR